MTSFDQREHAFEAAYQHNQEMQFKARARRNKLLGLWAAERLGLYGAEAEAYARTVVMTDFAQAGDDDVFRKIRDDFNVKSVAVTDQQIRGAMSEIGRAHV